MSESKSTKPVWKKMYWAERNLPGGGNNGSKDVDTRFTPEQQIAITGAREILADINPQWLRSDESVSSGGAFSGRPYEESEDGLFEVDMARQVAQAVSWYAEIADMDYEDAARELYQNSDGTGVMRGRNLGSCTYFALRCETICEEQGIVLDGSFPECLKAQDDVNAKYALD